MRFGRLHEGLDFHDGRPSGKTNQWPFTVEGLERSKALF